LKETSIDAKIRQQSYKNKEIIFGKKCVTVADFL
jgi:hypothetical protein